MRANKTIAGDIMDFSELKKYMELLVNTTGSLDTQIKVYKDKNEVFSYCGGFRDVAHTTPASFDDCFYFYSLSKPITCTAAMQLAERGLLDLDAPVSKYLPFFKNAEIKTADGEKISKNKILVWHLFSMQAGFNYYTDSAVFKKALEENESTLKILEAAVCTIPFSFPAGESWQYACRCHDALGCIIEKISGISLPEYLKKNIFEPLGMENIGFELKGYLSGNIADIFKENDEKTGLAVLPRMEFVGCASNYKSGAHGLIGTLDTYARFAVAMANGGVGANGNRIIKQETIDLMKTDRLGDGFRDKFHFSPFGYGYGLGVRTLITKEKGAPSAIGEFGWDGAAGAYTLMDNENNVAIVFLTHALSGNKNLDQLKIRDLAYKGLFE